MSPISWKSWYEFHSTTHFVKRTTFWFSISTWKIKKTSTSSKRFNKSYTPFKSSLRDKLHESYQKLNLKNVQTRQSNFFFTNMAPMVFNMLCHSKVRLTADYNWYKTYCIFDVWSHLPAALESLKWDKLICFFYERVEVQLNIWTIKGNPVYLNILWSKRLLTVTIRAGDFSPKRSKITFWGTKHSWISKIPPRTPPKI